MLLLNEHLQTEFIRLKLIHRVLCRYIRLGGGIQTLCSQSCPFFKVNKREEMKNGGGVGKLFKISKQMGDDYSVHESKTHLQFHGSLIIGLHFNG